MQKLRTLDELVKDEQKGLHLGKIDVGTEIVVETQNNVYTIDVLDNDGNVRIVGGEFFEVPKEAMITGSTWGGSAIRTLWIGLNMHLEVYCGRKRYVTTWIKSIHIIGKNYDFKLESVVCDEED